MSGAQRVEGDHRIVGQVGLRVKERQAGGLGPVAGGGVVLGLGQRALVGGGVERLVRLLCVVLGQAVRLDRPRVGLGEVFSPCGGGLDLRDQAGQAAASLVD